MQVNKEIANKVIEYANKQTDKWISSGKKDKISASVNPAARYSFYKFAVDNNLLDGSNERLNDVSITCPFHEDDAPSCNLNDHIHKWHCFSCERGGNIAGLMAEYDREILGITVSYYQKVNELLINDKEMQAAIGASSIYESSDDFSMEEALRRFKPRLHQADLPKSYSEMSSLMIKRGCSNNEIKYFILLMQAGESVEDIYKEIFTKESKKLEESKEEYDLQKMMLDI